MSRRWGLRSGRPSSASGCVSISDSEQRADRPELIYVADPMCSWCWGFSPVIGEIAAQVAGSAALRLVLGGLRPGTTDPMTADMKATIREHWRHVEEASGQPFDHGFFDRDGFVYDTEPACRAVVTVRETVPDLALPYLSAVQGAFYRDGRDVTDPAVLVRVAEELAIDGRGLAEALESSEMRAATAGDFSLAARMGVRGFPTLLGFDSARISTLAVGFRRTDELLPVVARWVADAATGAAPMP